MTATEEKLIESINDGLDKCVTAGITVYDGIQKNKKHSLREWQEFFEENKYPHVYYITHTLEMESGLNLVDIESRIGAGLSYPFAKISLIMENISMIPEFDDDNNIVFETVGDIIAPKMIEYKQTITEDICVDSLDVIKKSNLTVKYKEIRDE